MQPYLRAVGGVALLGGSFVADARPGGRPVRRHDPVAGGDADLPHREQPPRADVDRHALRRRDDGAVAGVHPALRGPRRRDRPPRRDGARAPSPRRSRSPPPPTAPSTCPRSPSRWTSCSSPCAGRDATDRRAAPSSPGASPPATRGTPKGLLEVGGVRILDRVVDALSEATGVAPVALRQRPGRGGLAARARRRSPTWSRGSARWAGSSPPSRPSARRCAWRGTCRSSRRRCCASSPAGLAAADVVIPESGGSRRGVEPLCAAYGPACGPAIRAALARGDQRAVGFHADVRVTRLPAAQVLMYGDPDVLFFNVNTPEDLQHAEAVCRARDSSR